MIALYVYISGDGLISPSDFESMELNHRQIEYGSPNTTLAWQVFPEQLQNNCNISQVLSYPRCQPDNILMNITTNSKRITLPSGRLHTSGGPADFSLSSLSDQPGTNCPSLSATVTVRFDGKTGL